MSNNSRLPSQEGYLQLLDILMSFKGEEGKRIVTVDICEKMEKKYGHVYEIFEMEKYLLELTKHNGLKCSGTTEKETPKKYLKKDTPEKDIPENNSKKEIFMPIKPDKDGTCRTSVWDV